MAQPTEERLLQAIKKDDIKAFRAMTETTRCGGYRLGRFPVLSLLYLYKSRKILSAYEGEFLRITDYGVFREPAEISQKFAKKAGKCLRLYFNEIVSPLEMLLILDRARRLKRVFPAVKPSAEIRARLQSIYAIRYALKVSYEGDEIHIDKRPLSYREKKNISTACLCTGLAIVLAVGVPVTTVSLIPKPVEGQASKLGHIKFSSAKEYLLTADITVPANYTVKKMNCTINGGGHKLILGKGASLGELNGKLSDLTIESTGDAIFTSVSDTAEIENITVNIAAELTASGSGAFVAQTNYGTIDGVTVNASGTVHAVAASEEVTADFVYGGIVGLNGIKYGAAQAGTVKNCTVNYSQFTLTGEASANAAFGGVVGLNGGYVQDCTVTGEMTSDTFDLAGVCWENEGMLSGNLNTANLTQTSSDTGWNPIVCGIVSTNGYAVENCENRGKISSTSDCGKFEVQEGFEPTVSAAGIAYLNRGTTVAPYLKNCTNAGEIISAGEYRNAYAAGVCLSSNGTIEHCKNGGSVTAQAEHDSGAYAGGIATISYGNIVKSVNEGGIAVTGNGTAYVGGISAHTGVQISNCVSRGDITVKAREICAGGIFGFSEVTTYGYYVYYGAAESCISTCQFSVKVIGNEPVSVGGIAGLVREVGLTSNGVLTYFGGSVTKCYFTGGCDSEISYFGNIAGASGSHIYEHNADPVGDSDFRNFDGNYYLENAFRSIGATVTETGSFSPASGKGAEILSREEIEESEAYLAILKEVE